MADVSALDDYVWVDGPLTIEREGSVLDDPVRIVAKKKCGLVPRSIAEARGWVLPENEPGGAT